MKKTIPILFLFLSAFSSKASGVRVDTAYVYTEYYNVDSSRILLFVKAMTGNQGCRIGSMNIKDTLNYIQADLCYYDGAATTPCQRTDTINLGVK